MSTMLAELVAVGVDKDYKEEAMQIPPFDLKEAFIEFTRPNGREERFAQYSRAHPIWQEVLRIAKEEKLSFKAQLDLPPEFIKLTHLGAYEAYQKGDYPTAFNLFRLLTIFDIGDYDYVYGTARCLQHMGYLTLAFKFYQLCIALQPDNPVPYLCCAECTADMQNKMDTLFFAEQAMVLSENKPEFKEVFSQASLMFDSILQEGKTLAAATSPSTTAAKSSSKKKQRKRPKK